MYLYATINKYNPLTMPLVLSKTHRELNHRELDRAVERCYRSKKPFANDHERLAFLFELYEKLTTGSLLNQDSLAYRTR
jgi:hypothetical protein